MNGTRNGRHWERVAESWLHRRGLKTLQRNFHCRLGEIDLVMTDQESIVFVEVRYRGPGSWTGGAGSVTRRKQLRLARAAGIFLNGHPRLAHRPCRFDVLAVDGAGGQPRFNWLRNAFQSSID